MLTTPTILKSEIDNSVNFLHHSSNDGGKLEARFVHRPGTDYFIAYVSSFSGCDQACRMCHLTSNGETMMTAAHPEQLLNQIDDAVVHAHKHFPHLRKMHINFMARGEPLLNKRIFNAEKWPEIVKRIHNRYSHLDEITERVSTIMPVGMDDQIWYFNETPSTILYYSLYSMNKQFRKRWLPKALPATEALHRLHQVAQMSTTEQVRFHWALIDDENDLDITALRIIGELANYPLFFPSSARFKPRLNLVRYNPPNDKSQESPRYEVYSEIFRRYGFDVKTIPRVGHDIAASCGMFVTGVDDGIPNHTDHMKRGFQPQ